MVAFTYVGTLGLGVESFVTGVTDIDIALVGGLPRLYSVTRTGNGGGFAAFDIANETGPAQALAQQHFGTGIGYRGMPQLAVIGGASGGVIVPGGVTQADRASYLLTGSGGFGGQITNAPGAGSAADLLAVASVEFNGHFYMFGVRAGAAQPVAYELGASGVLAQISPVLTAAPPPAAAVDALVTVDCGGQLYVITASSAADTISSHLFAADGSLHLVSQIDTTSGVGFAAPSALAAASVNGADYIIVAGSGSSSLSVLRLMPDGGLLAVDHVVDGLNTRFQAATAVETLEFGGRTYVIAGGGDDGISLFVMLPDGRLVHMSTLADTASTTLADVTAIAAAEAGGRAQVFVSSASEPGITQFTLQTGLAGVMVVGGSGLVNGSAGDDLLIAGVGSTLLNGGAGDDILVAGGDAGGVEMRGGPGADVFVLSATPGRLVIQDYQPGTDRLDLTSLPMLRSISQLGITPTVDGATLSWRGTTIEIHSANGSPILASRFVQSEMPTFTRYMPLSAPTLLMGTPGADDMVAMRSDDSTLIGFAGNDTLCGNSGNDRLEGGEGNDVLYGEDGNDWLYGGRDNDRIFGGAGNDLIDGGVGNDNLGGETGNDLVFAAAGNDVLAGGSGNDLLCGEAGDDRILGGAGNDLLGGGYGNDSLFGGFGNDRLYGALGDDLLCGGAGNDLLVGGEGNDTLWGEAGNDALFGTSGDNVLVGGSGNDVLHGGTGRDVLIGSAGADRFVFVNSAAVGIGATGDRISDFASGVDIIDLSAMRLTNIGTSGFSHTPGELRFFSAAGMGYLQGDIDGNGIADFTLTLDHVQTLAPIDLLL